MKGGRSMASGPKVGVVVWFWVIAVRMAANPSQPHGVVQVLEVRENIQ